MGICLQEERSTEIGWTQEKVMVNLIKIPCIYVWKSHDETHSYRTTESGKEVIYRKEIDEGDGGQKHDGLKWNPQTAKKENGTL